MGRQGTTVASLHKAQNTTAIKHIMLNFLLLSTLELSENLTKKEHNTE